MGPRPRVPTTDQTRSHLLSHVGDLVRSLGPDVIDDLQRGVEPLRRELLEDPLELRRDALLVGMYRQPSASAWRAIARFIDSGRSTPLVSTLTTLPRVRCRSR
jgi:hypothetical protein